MCHVIPRNISTSHKTVFYILNLPLFPGPSHPLADSSPQVLRMGFGEVVPDGMGVAYNLKDDALDFVVTSRDRSGLVHLSSERIASS